MTDKEKEPVTFSINERLVLDGQYGAAEFLSMALEPDMTIEEDPHFVKVTGKLKLTGEFRPASPSGNGEHFNEIYKPAHPIRKVFATDVGTYCIEHEFPVDITIPSYRITNMEELYVTIDAFDYFLEASRAIDLSADILLSGLTSTQDQVKTGRTYDQRPQKDQYLGVPSHETFAERDDFPFLLGDEADLTQNNNENYHSFTTGDQPASDEVYEFEAIRNPEDHPFLKDDEALPHLEIKERPEYEEEEDDEQDDYENSEEPIFHQEAEGRSEVESESEDAVETDEQEEYLPAFEYKERKESSLDYDDSEEDYYNEDDPQAYQSVDETERLSENTNAGESDLEPEAVEKPKENALYLTKMLSEDTKQFSKVRMYFIQPGDSLTSVAEKYKLAATSLIRMNRLESDQLKPGEILYIPVK